MALQMRNGREGEGRIERDKAIDATVTAACPDCGDSQAIHAHRVVSVTGEKAQTSNLSNSKILRSRQPEQ